MAVFNKNQSESSRVDTTSIKTISSGNDDQSGAEHATTNAATIALENSKRQASQKSFQKTIIRTDHLQNKPLIQRINWINVAVVFGVPLIGIYGALTLERFYMKTIIWSIIYYFLTGLGITAGYHRYWSHKSFECSPLMSFLFMCFGSGALEGSIKWWCLLHRAHHRWTDTDHDPYNSQRGFFYCHVGWLLLDNITVTKEIDINDLKSQPMIRWQHQNYLWFGPFMTFLFPALVGYALCDGDFRGGLFLAGFLRAVFVHHATWCVNSVAHYYGEAKFDDTLSPKDSILTGLLTLGEGYHNFHHEFPNDWRNGIRWYDYDPTKWLIGFLSQCGLTYDLKEFPSNEIEIGKIDMIEKKLRQKKSTLSYGPAIESLPSWPLSQIESEKKDKLLLIISGVVHDVTPFVTANKHPGGKAILIQHNGKDVTKAFNGDVYNHTNAARNLMAHFRIARITSTV